MEENRGPLQPAARRLHHAYILTGPGRTAAAGNLAAAFVCDRPEQAPCGTCPHCRKARAGIHPDIITLTEERLSVDQVRTLRADAWIRPNEARRKVYLIANADGMLPPAQNALLKLLEDGPAYAAFLLLAENDAALLPTVRSRCQTLRGAESDPDPLVPEDPVGEQLARALLAGDELEVASLCAQERKRTREEVISLLDSAVAALMRALPQDPHRAMPLLAHLRQLRSLCDNNLGVTHLLGWLAAGPGVENKE